MRDNPRRKPGTRRPPISNTYWRGEPGNEVLWARLEIEGRPIRWSLRLRHPFQPGDVDIARGRIEARRKELIAAVHYGETRKRYVDVQLTWASHIAREVSPSTATRYEVSLRQLKPWLDCWMDEVNTRAKIREIIDGRRQASPTVTNATLRRDLVALSSVIDFALHEEDIKSADDHNAATAALKRLSERRDPIVLPEHSHIARVIAAAAPSLAPLIMAAWKTGCRQAELVTAERSRIDHDRRQLTVVGKRNKLRVIDLVTPAGDAYGGLRAAPARLGCRWLFWHHGGEPYRAASQHFGYLVERVLADAIAEEAARARKAGVAPGQPDFRPFTFHHLRHRFAVDYLKGGGSIYDLQQHLGHTSVKTTEIYLAYLTPDEARLVKAGSGARGVAIGRMEA
jgi:integrase/recombinase XerD